MSIAGLLGARRIQLLDIGARDGLHPRWQRFLPVLDVIGFEADTAECARLNGLPKDGTTRRRFLPYALSGCDGEQTFHVCARPGYSGLYEPDTARVAPFAGVIQADISIKQRLSICTTTLDALTAKESLQPDYLKLDVQGAELDILKGGASLLARTKMIELEVEFNPIYVDQPVFSDVDRFLRQQGFALLGLRRTCWRRHSTAGMQRTTAGGQIMHGDVLYYNADLLAKDRYNTVDMLVWLTLLSAYRQEDFVEQLLEATPDLSAHAQMIRDVMHYRAKVRDWLLLARLIVAGRITHTIARAILDSLRRRPAIDWHDPDFY